MFKKPAIGGKQDNGGAQLLNKLPKKQPANKPAASAKRQGTGPFSSLERMIAWRYLRSRRRDSFISVIAENTIEKLCAKAVHHRHNDDECGNAEHDAGKGEAGKKWFKWG